MIYASLAFCEGIPQDIAGLPARRVKNAELWCHSQKGVEQSVEMSSEVCDAMTVMWHYNNEIAAQAAQSSTCLKANNFCHGSSIIIQVKMKF